MWDWLVSVQSCVMVSDLHFKINKQIGFLWHTLRENVKKKGEKKSRV